MSEKTEFTPEDFVFADWMAGAHKPTRGSTVYQRGDLMADLDRVREQIEVAELIPADERSLTDASPDKLRKEYETLAEQFYNSGLFVKMAGLTPDEQVTISNKLDKETYATHEKGDKSDEALEKISDARKTLTYRLMAASIVSPKLDESQLRQLHQIIGDAQFNKLVQDYKLASATLNEPDADFLRKPSTPQETGE